jgi:TetR/AcrR family transcriptional repressor of nem operon
MATRQPQITRQQILQAAFQAVYEHGLSATSLDAVLARTGVTKGALYHHFDGKQALGCALIDEVLAPRIRETWIEPLQGEHDPIGALQRLLREQGREPSPQQLRYGCPLNNMAQELSALDERLRSRVESILQCWVDAVRDALRAGQADGKVRPDADARQVATFVVGAIEGALSLGKASREARVIRAAFGELASYLETLRPGATARRSSRR